MRRTIGLAIVTIIVASVCVRLGFWQLSRLEQRRAANARIEAGLAAPEAPLTDVLGRAEDPYRRVRASGTYITTSELLLYGRALDGEPGDHVLTPLRLSGGAVVLVDRGWVPFDADRVAPAPDAPPPRGRVEVHGILLPGEEGEAFPEGRTGDTVRAVDLAAIGDVTGLSLGSAYLLLQTQIPTQPGDLPVPATLVARDEGPPHLSYAIQWFSFAAIAVLGYGLLSRRDRRHDDATGEDAD